MATDFSVSPADSLQTILQKLDTAIQTEETTIAAAQTRLTEFRKMRESLSNLLPTDPASTETPPDVPVKGKAPAAAQTTAKPTAKAAAPKAATTKTTTTKPVAAASAAKAAPPKSQKAGKSTTSKSGAKPAANPATTTAAKPERTDSDASGTKAPVAAAKTTATNTASVRAFNLSRYQEASGIPKGTPLQEAIALLLASLPDQSFGTPDLVRRLYGTLKPSEHAGVLPMVQSALTAGLRQGLWVHGTVRKPPTYQHKSA